MAMKMSQKNGKGKIRNYIHKDSAIKIFLFFSIILCPLLGRRYPFVFCMSSVIAIIFLVLFLMKMHKKEKIQFSQKIAILLFAIWFLLGILISALPTKAESGTLVWIYLGGSPILLIIVCWLWTEHKF